MNNPYLLERHNFVFFVDSLDDNNDGLTFDMRTFVDSLNDQQVELLKEACVETQQLRRRLAAVQPEEGQSLPSRANWLKLTPEELSILCSGGTANRIAAIKAYRDRTRVSLREARDAVDAAMNLL